MKHTLNLQLILNQESTDAPSVFQKQRNELSSLKPLIEYFGVGTYKISHPMFLDERVNFSFTPWCEPNASEPCYITADLHGYMDGAIVIQTRKCSDNLPANNLLFKTHIAIEVLIGIDGN